jgi:RNA polymerase sigma factor (sigma-70 family)
MNKRAVTFVTDEQLIDQFRKGNQSVIGILYKRYYNKVYRKCFSYCKNTDEAFDLTQDVLIKAFTKIHTYLGNSSFSTWLFVIANNHCIGQLRKNKNIHFEKIELCYDIFDEAPDFEARLDYETKEESLNSHLDEISEQDKKMLVLKYHYNYSIFDLQKEFNLNASAVKMRLQRARQKVGQRMLIPQLQVAV